MTQHIVAMGGDGFSKGADNSLLDQYILDLTGKERPKVCFLAQASAESPDYTLNFYQAFTKLNAIPSHLSFFGRVPRAWENTLLAQDIIYVGGGNTLSMLAIWREWGADKVLQQALEQGIVLAGISAGAICWYEECVTDSIWPLGSIKGLGFLKGSACPHYDGEAERRPTYMQMVKNGDTIAGLAFQDYAGAHYVDGELKQIITSRPNANVYHVSLKDGKAVENALPKVYLGAEG